MPLSRDSRTEKKLKAARRAEFALRQRFERIDWEEEVLYPEIEALKAGKPVLGLEAGAIFELVLDESKAGAAAGNPADGDSSVPDADAGDFPPYEGA